MVTALELLAQSGCVLLFLDNLFASGGGEAHSLGAHVTLHSHGFALAHALAHHLFAVVPGRAPLGTTAWSTSNVSVLNSTEVPEAWLTPVAFLAPDARLTGTLLVARITDQRVGAKIVTVAQTWASGILEALRRCDSIGTASIHRVFAARRQRLLSGNGAADGKLPERMDVTIAPGGALLTLL